MGLRELFEAGNQAWNEGDFERVYAALADDVDYQLGSAWPLARPLRGKAEVVAFFDDFRQTFPDARANFLDFEAADDGAVIVGFNIIGSGRSSGAGTSMEIWQVWEPGEAGYSRVREFPTREAALAAAEVAA